MAEIEVTRRGDGLVAERTGFRLSWGAIFAGFVVATVLQIALSLLGVGLGFVGWDPGDPVADLGMGALIWAALTAIITLFIGGMTTGRLAGVLTRGDGALHGVIMWALSTLLALYLVFNGLTFVLGGAFGILGSTVSTAAGAVATGVAQAGAAAVGQAGNLDLGALQREIEATLRATGDPRLQPEAIQQDLEAVRDTVTSGATNESLAQALSTRIQATAGRVDREDLINVVTARTGMTRAEAENVVDRIETAAANARTQIATTAEDVGQEVTETAGAVAEDVQSALVRGSWLALLVMGLSVAAAAAGASMTARE